MNSALKIFDAAEEVMRMDDLQLKWQRKNGWKYFRKSLDELRAALDDNVAKLDVVRRRQEHVEDLYSTTLDEARIVIEKSKSALGRTIMSLDVGDIKNQAVEAYEIAFAWLEEYPKETP